MLAACHDREERREEKRGAKESHNLERFLTRSRKDGNGQPGRQRRSQWTWLLVCVAREKTPVLYESTLIDTPRPSITAPSRLRRSLAPLGYSRAAFSHKHPLPRSATLPPSFFFLRARCLLVRRFFCFANEFV